MLASTQDVVVLLSTPGVPSHGSCERTCRSDSPFSGMASWLERLLLVLEIALAASIEALAVLRSIFQIDRGSNLSVRYYMEAARNRPSDTCMALFGYEVSVSDPEYQSPSTSENWRRWSKHIDREQEY